MIRKSMTALLSLLLALMLPLCAFAGAQHTLTIIPGDDLASEPAVADLLKVLAITVTPGEKSGALTLSLDGMDVATVAIGADVTGLYAHSNLLSDDVLYITWDDAFALVKNAMQSAMMNEYVDMAGIDAVLSQVDEAQEQLISVLSGDLAISAGVTTQEEALAQTAVLFPDDPEMADYIKEVYAKMTVEEGIFTAENRDAADQKYTLVMTEEDFLTVIDSHYMRQQLVDMLRMSNPDLTGDEMAEQVEEQLKEMREVFENTDMSMTTEVFTLDEGKTIVGMTIDMTMTVTEEETAETAKMLMAYNRLTDEAGEHYNADMKMNVDGADAMEAIFDFTRGVDAVSEGMLAFLVDGEEMTIAYRGENTQPDVREREAALYLRSNATSIIEPAVSDRPLITFRVITSPADPQVLGKIENADGANSVNVMKLSDEELQTLFGEMSSRSMQAMYMALAKLPTSVLNLVMGQ